MLEKILFLSIVWVVGSIQATEVGMAAPDLVLGYDQGCWKKNDALMAHVSAVPITCQATSGCQAFEQSIPLKSKAGYQVNFSEVTKKIGMNIENTILLVSICADKNKNQRCDEKPVAHVLRLNGRHFKTLYPEGFVDLNFQSIHHPAGYCESL